MRPGVILFRLAVHVSTHCHENWPCLLIEAVGRSYWGAWRKSQRMSWSLPELAEGTSSPSGVSSPLLWLWWNLWFSEHHPLQRPWNPGQCEDSRSAWVMDLKRKSVPLCSRLECRWDGAGLLGSCRWGRLSINKGNKLQGLGSCPWGAAPPALDGCWRERAISILLKTLLFGVSVTALKHMGEVHWSDTQIWRWS